ncbi:MAG: hypothetical protein RIQ52_1188 [Pseudomonadota bacterium]
MEQRPTRADIPVMADSQMSGTEHRIRSQSDQFGGTLRKTMLQREGGTTSYPEAAATASSRKTLADPHGTQPVASSTDSEPEMADARDVVSVHEGTADPAAGLYGLRELFEQLPMDESAIFSGMTAADVSGEIVDVSGQLPVSHGAEQMLPEVAGMIAVDGSGAGMDASGQLPVPPVSDQSSLLQMSIDLGSGSAAAQIPSLPVAEDQERQLQSVDAAAGNEVTQIQLGVAVSLAMVPPQQGVVPPEAGSRSDMPADQVMKSGSGYASVAGAAASPDLAESVPEASSLLPGSEVDGSFERVGAESLLMTDDRPSSQSEASASSPSFSHVMARSSPSSPPMTPVQRQESIPQPFSQPGWNEAFSSRVSLLAGQGISSAHLQINPPDLGPIEIHMELDNDRLNIDFASNHASVRDAVEASMPRLREMLAQQNIELADTSVSTMGSNQTATGDSASWAAASGGQAGTGSEGRRSLAEADADPSVSALETQEQAATVQVRDGLLSLYA